MTVIDHIITPRSRDLGGFTVKRILPHAQRRTVGPFIFLDEMGPARFAPGQGVDVRPHPHIGLSTVTWLFDGELTHHDTTGAHISIRPGDLNWMTAGHGVVHSERTNADVRAAGHRLHGLQAWVALPDEAEDGPAGFDHYPADALPSVTRPGVAMTIVAGEAYGARSPVRIHSPLFYVMADLAPGAQLPTPDGHDERAIYVVEGALTVDGAALEAGALGVLATGVSGVAVAGEAGARIALLGGANVGPRFIDWNFVASSKEAIAAARADWIAAPDRGWAGRFTLPEGETEFIPLTD